MTYRSVSVLTLVRGRQVHLDHLIAGLHAQARMPDELIVAFMQDVAPRVPPDCPFPIRLLQIEGDALPLAKARNHAADQAEGEILAFLDVDCIPDRNFVKRAIEAVDQLPDGVFLPEVRYLPGNPGGWLDNTQRAPDVTKLEWAGKRHPAKPDLSMCATRAIQDFGEIWGLAFILTGKTWDSAGGMDERYVGYGAEETDFGRRLERAGAELYWLGGTVCYHQHHTINKPPLQHFESIVRNATLFHDCWHEWCMDYWLDDFARRGLIERDADKLTVIRHPTALEIAKTTQGPEVRFS